MRTFCGIDTATTISSRRSFSSSQRVSSRGATTAPDSSRHIAQSVTVCSASADAPNESKLWTTLDVSISRVRTAMAREFRKAEIRRIVEMPEPRLTSRSRPIRAVAGSVNEGARRRSLAARLADAPVSAVANKLQVR